MCEHWNEKLHKCELGKTCDWDDEAPCYKEKYISKLINNSHSMRIYVVVGELEDTDQIDCFEGAYTSMTAADERCTELESHPDNCHIWYWREVVLEGGK